MKSATDATNAESALCVRVSHVGRSSFDNHLGIHLFTCFVVIGG